MNFLHMFLHKWNHLETHPRVNMKSFSVVSLYKKRPTHSHLTTTTTPTTSERWADWELPLHTAPGPRRIIEMFEGVLL